MVARLISCAGRRGLALLAFSATLWCCHSQPVGSDGGVTARPSDAPAPLASASATTEEPAVSATAISESDEPLPTLDGSTVKLELSGGATLTLPAGARERPSSAEALESVLASHVYQLGGDKRLLMVNELLRDGRDCDARLDDEWQRMQRARDDADERRRAYRRMVRVEQGKVGAARVLYSEALQRGFSGKDKRPFAAIATMASCRDDRYLVLMVASDRPSLPRGLRAMLEAIVASYRPAS
jgi:hypothetical protein